MEWRLWCYPARVLLHQVDLEYQYRYGGRRTPWRVLVSIIGFLGGSPNHAGAILWGEWHDAAFIYGHSSEPIFIQYCTARYHTHFSSPLKARAAIWNFLVLAGLDTNCLRAFPPTVEPPPLKPLQQKHRLQLACPCIHPLRKSNNCALPCSCSLPGPLEPHTNIGGGESL